MQQLFVPQIGNVPPGLAFDASGNLKLPGSLDVRGPAPYFDVKAFGAVGNGTSDDTAAINSAIAAVAAQTRGGCVYFPTGLYLISSALTTLPNNCALRGADRGSTVLLVASTFLTGDIITCPAGGDGITIADIALFSSTTRTSGAGINTNGCNDIIVQDFTLNGMFNGIYVNGGSIKVLITNGQINASGVGTGVGILIVNGAAGDTYLRGIVMSNPAATASRPLAGIRVQQTGHSSILECNVTGCLTGLQVDPGAGQLVNYLFVDHALFDSNSTNGAWFNAATATSSIQSVKCANAWFSGSGTGPGLLTAGVSGGVLDDLELVACRFLNNGTHGVSHGYGTNLAILGGTIAGNSVASANTSDGVNVAAGVSNWKVVASKIGTAGAARTVQQRYGVYVNSGASNFYQVANNDLIGNQTGALSDNGTGPVDQMGPNIGGNRLGGVAALSAAVTAAATELSIISTAIAPGSVQPGTTWRLKAKGTGTTGTAGTLTIRVRIGPTTLTGAIVTSVAPAVATTGTGKGFVFEATVAMRTVGSSGTAIGECFIVADATTGYVLNTFSATTATAAVNTTVANLIEVTAITSAAGDTLNVQVANIEVVKA